MIESFVTPYDIDSKLKELGVSESQIISIHKSDDCAEKTVYYTVPDPLDDFDDIQEPLITVLKKRFNDVFNKVKLYFINDIAIRFIIADKETGIINIKPDRVIFRDRSVEIKIPITRHLVDENNLDDCMTSAIKLYGKDPKTLKPVLIREFDEMLRLNTNTDILITYIIDFDSFQKYGVDHD